jgi:hypothetical protein
MTSNLSRSAKRGFWEKVIEEWSATGLSQTEYCRQKRIRIKSFQYWKRNLRRSVCAPALVELPLKLTPTAMLRSSPELCVVVDQLFRIEIERGFDPEDLERVIRVLRRI